MIKKKSIHNNVGKLIFQSYAVKDEESEVDIEIEEYGSPINAKR